MCGIPLDATSRELHILFSGCPGYAFATLVLDQEPLVKPFSSLFSFFTFKLL